VRSSGSRPHALTDLRRVEGAGRSCGRHGGREWVAIANQFRGVWRLAGRSHSHCKSATESRSPACAGQSPDPTPSRFLKKIQVAWPKLRVGRGPPCPPTSSAHAKHQTKVKFHHQTKVKFHLSTQNTLILPPSFFSLCALQM
jgi:hypothetical protein